MKKIYNFTSSYFTNVPKLLIPHRLIKNFFIYSLNYRISGINRYGYSYFCIIRLHCSKYYKVNVFL